MAQLRDCQRDASDGTVEALQKIVPAIRQRFGSTPSDDLDGGAYWQKLYEGGGIVFSAADF